MVNIHKIKELAKDKGLSLAYLSTRLGVSKSYFTDVKNHKTTISSERLITIAELLDTTPEYLLDLTEVKVRTSQVGADSLSREEEEVLLAYRSKPDMQKAVRKLLDVDIVHSSFLKAVDLIYKRSDSTSNSPASNLQNTSPREITPGEQPLDSKPSPHKNNDS